MNWLIDFIEKHRAKITVAGIFCGSYCVFSDIRLVQAIGLTSVIFNIWHGFFSSFKIRVVSVSDQDY